MRFISNVLKKIVVYGSILGISLLGVRGCDNIFNNRTIKKPSYEVNSYATGITGHVEYIKYANGAQDVKEYPGLAHRFFDSELHQDLNGDGLVDKIIQNGAEWKMNSLTEILVRQSDYEKNKERFDNADKKLQILMKKYSSNLTK